MLIFLLLVPTTQAETVRFVALDIGKATCTQMVEDFSAGYETEYVAYMAGFMNAVDVFNHGIPATYVAPETLVRAALAICKTKRRAKTKFATVAVGVHQRAVKRELDGPKEMVKR
jgi:hypothetical protein